MSKRMRAVVVAAASLCLCAAGCSPPVVSVRHTLPAALPLPADITDAGLRVEQFRVFDAAVADPAARMKVTPKLASLITVRLGEALKKTLPAAADGKGVVGGSLDVSIADTRGRRRILGLDPAAKAAVPLEVPTLLRTVTLRVEFSVSRVAGGGEGFGIAEVVRTYDSAADPAVRGELGLERADDPNRVPPVETILDDLVVQCAEAFKRMITPTPADAEIQLRSVAGADDAFAAASKADWPGAVAAFQKALAADPESPAMNFNLAAVAEAADQLDLAARHYEHALKLSGENDPEAQNAARRCRRVLASRKQAGAKIGEQGL